MVDHIPETHSYLILVYYSNCHSQHWIPLFITRVFSLLTNVCDCDCVTVIYLLSTIIQHYKAACTINELDSKAALVHLQLSCV